MLLCTYVLFCPVTGEIRYVGKSDRHLDKRVKEHLSEAKRKDLGRRGEWLRELIAQDLEPLIEHDVDIPDDVPWQKIERDRIAYYLSIGCDLVNGTAGGEGLHKPTEAVRASMRKPHILSPVGLALQQANALRMAAANLGSKRSPESRALMSAKATGRKASPETKAKMRAAKIGHKQTSQWNARISAAHMGKVQGPHTPEHRAKIGAGLRRYRDSKKKSDDKGDLPI